MNRAFRHLIAVFYAPIGWDRARFLMRKIAPHLVGETLLDLGAGTGHTAVLLSSESKITMLDVAPHKGAFGQMLVGQPVAAHLAHKHDLKRVRYDGRRIPFENDVFDVVLIAFVLHHCEAPELVLREAARVAKRRILVLEDVNGEHKPSRFERFLDALWNLELFHPHEERTRSAWLKVFDSCSLNVIVETNWTWKMAGFGVRQTMWVLEVPEV